MKSKAWTFTIAACLAVAVTMCTGLAAQQQSPDTPPKYSVVWLKPFGGSQSNVAPYARDISDQQAMIGTGDTSDLDPNFPNSNFLLGQDVYIQHAAVVKDTIRTDLGALPGLNSSSALWINATGTVAGISTNGSIDPLIGIPEGRAVIWKNGEITDLGTLGGNESVAWVVNSSDQVTGCAADAIPDDASLFGWGTQTRAFLYQNGVMQDLGTLGGPDACGTLLNDAGQVTGFSYTDSYVVDVFLWTKGNMQDIGGLGGTNGFPNYINSKGQVTGESNLAGDTISHGFFWDGAAMHDIGSLSGGFQSNYSTGIAMNDAGDIVGESLVSSTASHAFLWKNGVMTDLGTLPGDRCSIAWSINNKDQIVGGSGLCGSPQHAFLWQNGQMYDLSHVLPLNAVMTTAFYINDAGQIAVSGNSGHGGNGSQAYTTIQRAFLLLPFPPQGGSDLKQDSEQPASRVGASRDRLGGSYRFPGPAAPRD